MARASIWRMRSRVRLKCSPTSSRERGRPPQLQLQPGPGLLEAGEGVAGVDGQADGAARVGDAPGDGLADPPRGVGGELEALAPVELLDGVHQAQVPLLDEVEERKS